MFAPGICWKKGKNKLCAQVWSSQATWQVSAGILFGSSGDDAMASPVAGRSSRKCCWLMALSFDCILNHFWYNFNIYIAPVSHSPFRFQPEFGRPAGFGKSYIYIYVYIYIYIGWFRIVSSAFALLLSWNFCSKDYWTRLYWFSSWMLDDACNVARNNWALWASTLYMSWWRHSKTSIMVCRQLDPPWPTSTNVTAIHQCPNSNFFQLCP